MKDSVIKPALSIFLLFLVILFNFISGDGVFLVITLPFILIGTASISFFLASWSNSDLKTSFRKNLMKSLGISAFICLMGYIYTATAPLIF